MLLVDQRQIKFVGRQFLKVLHVAQVVNNGIILAGTFQFKKDCLTYVNSDGKIVDEIIFKHNTDSFAALSDRQVMVLETRENNILVWKIQQSLDKCKRINIPFFFKTIQTDQSQIFVFSQTKLVCIVENGRYNNNTFKLTYFRYPLVENQEPIFEYESDEVWNYQYVIKKGNNHSMICWFKGRHDDGFQFKTFDLRDVNLDDPSQKVEAKVHNFPNDIGKQYGIDTKVEVAITTMWEMTPSKFMLVCLTNLPNDQNKKKNNNYVYESSLKLLRPARFIFPEDFNDLTIDQNSFGSTCMFRTFGFENGKALRTPVYYISNETQEIITQQTWQCSYLHKYDFTGYDGNLIQEYLCENANVSKITILGKKIMEPSEIFVNFLLGYFSEWDDDLLAEVVNIISKN